MNNTKGDKTINLPTVNFPTQDGKLKPKVENQTDGKTAKSESENKRKSTSDTETRIVSFVTENTESTNEFVGRTYQIIPFPLSSNTSNENNSTEILTEQKNTRYAQYIFYSFVIVFDIIKIYDYTHDYVIMLNYSLSNFTFFITIFH